MIHRAYIALWQATAARRARCMRLGVIAVDRRISAARKVAALLGMDTQSQDVKSQEDTVLRECIPGYRRQAFGDADLRMFSAAEDLAGLCRRADLQAEAIVQYECALSLRDPGAGGK